MNEQEILKWQSYVAGLDFKPLFVTVSGAHIYGFNSPDSDVDLRGCHQLPLEAIAVSYTHLRAHETGRNLVCRLLLEKKK